MSGEMKIGILMIFLILAVGIYTQLPSYIIEPYGDYIIFAIAIGFVAAIVVAAKS